MEYIIYKMSTMIETYEKIYRNILNIMMLSLSIDNESKPQTTMNNNKPLMVIGPSAVGKDTLINKLKNKYPDVVYKLPSYTTRPKRDGEIDGIDYYFVTKREFFKLRDEGKLFGIQEYNSNWYASNKAKLNQALENKNKIVVLNYNINTANAVKNEIDFNYVAILPPSETALRERLKQRNTKTEEIETRMSNSITEIQLISEANYIHFRLVNDELEKSFTKLENHLMGIYPQLQ